jgi:SSS family solute:Na+ symporter
VKKDGHQKNAEDYFLASKSLPWWAIGSSLIAANISAEQFIGMSGSGFALGLDSLYEWMAAFTLIIVGNIFYPFLSKRVFILFLNLWKSDFQLTLKRFWRFWIAYIFC